MNKPLFSFPNETSFQRSIVHPLVLFEILDQYMRRDKGDRIIGALLGTIYNDTVEIRDCFTIPHGDDEDKDVCYFIFEINFKKIGCFN